MSATPQSMLAARPRPQRDSAPSGRRIAASAIGLAIAGILAPVAVTAAAAYNALPGPPLQIAALVAVLVLGPAGVGLAASSSGLLRLAGILAAQSGGEAEHALLRVFVATAMFGHALALVTLEPDGSPATCLPVAALALVGAWAALLHVILWPAAPPARRYGGLLLDITLLLAFLHWGGVAASGWYPLYPLVTLYAGFRYGAGALYGTAAASAAGFAAVALTGEPWRGLPGLSAGLLLGLVLLPVITEAAIRGLAAARQMAATADAERRGALRLIAAALRRPLAELTAAPGLAAAAHAVQQVADFAALDAGGHAGAAEIFDPRRLLAGSLAELRSDAAGRGIILRWRVDARLPARLHGRAGAFAALAATLAACAIDASPGGTARLVLDVVEGDGRHIVLQLAAEGAGAAQPDRLALELGRRLADLLGGELAWVEDGDQPLRLAATLVLMVAADGPEPAIDLAGQPAVIATADARLAEELTRWLISWNGEPRWPGDADAVIAEDRAAAAAPVVVIVDGRGGLLPALSLAHHLAQQRDTAPSVLLLAGPEQIARLGEVDGGQIDGFIPAPATERALANALRSLPLSPRLMPPPVRTATPEAAVERPAVRPRFAADPAADLFDRQIVDELGIIGGGPAFVAEVIESFRADAEQLLRRVGEAAAAADADAFARGIAVLHRAAAHLGGTQLCATLASLQNLTANDLRRRGAAHVERLDAELERFNALLREAAPVPAERH